MCLFVATVAAMYYSYYMLPDGTYCLAPPPPGIDVAAYYNALPAGVTVSSATGVATVPPPPGTTPPPPPDTTDSTTGLTSTTTSTRYLGQICMLVGGVSFLHFNKGCLGCVLLLNQAILTAWWTQRTNLSTFFFVCFFVKARIWKYFMFYL